MGKQLGSKQLTDAERLDVYHSLLTKFENGKLLPGARTQTALFFKVRLPTVTRIWERSKEVDDLRGVAAAIKKRHKGGKTIITPEKIDAALRSAPVKSR